MPKNQQRRNKNEQSTLSRVMTSRALIIGEVMLLVLLAGAVGKEVIRKHQIQSDIDALERQAAQLQHDNEDLTSLISYFESDSYAEEQARLQLGLQRPGESVVTVLGAETETSSYETGVEGNTYTQTATDRRSNPQRWWSYFFNSSHNEG